MSNKIEEKLDQFKKQIQRNEEQSSSPKERTMQRVSSLDNKNSRVRSKTFRDDENLQLEEGGTTRNRRMISPEDQLSSVDNINSKLQMKRNPNFGGQPQVQNQGASDDDIPVGFSRRKRLSSQSSIQKKFEPQAQNIVNLSRVEATQQKEHRESVYEQQNVQELNKSIQKANQEEEERVHEETEQMLEQKREEIQRRLRHHEEAIRQEKAIQHQSQHYPQSQRQLSPDDQHQEQLRHQRYAEPAHQNQSHQSPNYQQQIAFPSQQRDANARSSLIPPYQMPQIFMPQSYPQQQMAGMPGMPGMPPNIAPAQMQHQQQLQSYAPHNHFPPQMMPNLPQYTNLDIPGYLDQNLKSMRETLDKLKGENQTLKTDLNKKQVQNADMQPSTGVFDKEKYQQNAHQNLKLKQNLEDVRRREIELKSRLSSLQANKQYLNGRTTTLSMDIDTQDRQEDALNRQINEFNGLIRDKESYIKQLMNELNSLKENKEQFQSELHVLSHKEEFLVNELIFKEDQLNEIQMNNDEMRRKIQAGQSQSKFLLAENERLKKEHSSLKEESAVLKASSDFLQNELMGLNEHLSEYEHKIVLSQNTIDQLQRQSQQDKNELSHYNSTVANQQQAYEELKNQLQIINERNSRIGMQNEMMLLRQQQHQEQLQQQMSNAAAAQRQQQAYSGQMSPFYQANEPREKTADKQEEIMRAVEDSLGPSRQGQKPQEQPRSKAVQRQTIDLVSNNNDEKAYETIKKKNKRGDSMVNTLKWEEDLEGQASKNGAYNRNNRSPAALDNNRHLNSSQRNQGGAMAGLLNWTEDKEQVANRFSAPQTLERKKFHLNQNQPPATKGDNDYVESGEFESPDRYNGRQERSKSAKREDQMNSIMQWEGEDTVKQQRLKKSEEQKFSNAGNSSRLISSERKRKEGQQMSGILSWDDKPNTFRGKETMRERELIKATQSQRAHGSPSSERKIIRDSQHGQSMAGLLGSQPEQHQQRSSPQIQQQRAAHNQGSNKYGQVIVNLDNPSSNQNTLNIPCLGKNEDPSYLTPNRRQENGTSNQHSSAKIRETKKVDIDLGPSDSKEASKGASGDNSFSQKNYGEVSHQLHKQQQNRKENLDKLLLQMQIEKEKMNQELNRIGEFPKTVKHVRRKDELQTELKILNSNIMNTKTKLKSIKI